MMDLMTQAFVLFFTFIRIGLFSFGGGYAMLPMIEHEVVLKQGWLVASEFKNLVVLSQITPGPIAVNAATYSGVKAIGYGGAIIATLGISLVSFFMVSFLLKHLEAFKTSPQMAHVMLGIRPAVVILIAYAAYKMGVGSVGTWQSWAVMAVVVLLHGKFKISAAWLMIGSACLGVFLC